MVLESDFPPDSRVEKEAISLFEQGHEIHIICYSNERLPEFELKDKFTIHRIKFSGFFRYKISVLALVLPFYFIKWRKAINRSYKKYLFDVIHVHDLPLSKVGYYFKKKYGCQLVCDQHEFYSNWIYETAHMNTLLGKIIARISNWKSYEKKYLNLADLIITVAKPLEENYLQKYDVKKDKIITVPNTPTKNIYCRKNIQQEIVEKYKKDFVIFYAGGIDILRGIDTAIRALKIIKGKIPNVKLLLCGKIRKPYDPFKTANIYNVTDVVDFKGWIDEDEIPSYISASQICFFTPPVNRDEINKTIATKIYQYAIMERPMIVSDAKMMKDFVEKNKLGIAIKTNDSEAFANAVFDIYNHKFSLGKNDANEDWLWEKTVSPLILKYNYLEQIRNGK